MEMIYDPKFHIDVTKRVKWHEVNNDMVHNYYYLVYVRIYNADAHATAKQSLSYGLTRRTLLNGLIPKATSAPTRRMILKVCLMLR